MRGIIILFALIGCSFSSHSQLTKCSKKLIGTWEYRFRDGFEKWTAENDVLIGSAYRVNKVGDTTKVEDLQIKKINKSFVYSIKTKVAVADSLTIESYNFVGTKKKMIFYNIDSNIPTMISYTFGFLNRNKLKISIQYGVKDEPVVLILSRSKE